MALNRAMISVTLLCTMVLLASGAGSASAQGRGRPSGGNMRGWPAAGAGGKGHGNGRGGMQGGRVSPLQHNTTLYANLTDASNTRIGIAELALFLNTNASDYILRHSVRVKMPAGDTFKSASVRSGSEEVFSLSTNGMLTRGNNTIASGTYKGLSTLKTSGGQTYLAVLEAMIAAPGSYSAQVVSTNAASGLASGVFAKRTANGQHRHNDGSGVNTVAASTAAVRGRNGGMRH